MDVKRRRGNAALEIDRAVAKSGDEFRTFSASILDLPEAIFIDILLRLPLKGIIVCKCICKRWRRLILSPQFAKFHFATSQTCLLLRNLDSTCVPRLCYRVYPSEVDTKSCLGCDDEIHISLNVKLKIPLRNPRDAFDMEAVKQKRRVKLRLTDHKFRVVNSCNGFLCLSEPSANEPAIVCNPVTGEFIDIPEAEDAYEGFVDCGFGFCPTTNQYKVIRIFDLGDNSLMIECPVNYKETFGYTRMAEVHRVGTQTWEEVGYAPFYFGKLASPTYLGGNLHWLQKGLRSMEILAFDFAKDSFWNFPPPSFEFNDIDIPHISMAVLRGNLCLCLANQNSVTLWVMEKYGVQDSWTKLLKFRKAERDRCFVCYPINYMNCGSLLMFYYPRDLLIHYNVGTKKFVGLDLNARQFLLFRVFSHSKMLCNEMEYEL